MRCRRCGYDFDESDSCPLCGTLVKGKRIFQSGAENGATGSTGMNNNPGAVDGGTAGGAYSGFNSGDNAYGGAESGSNSIPYSVPEQPKCKYPMKWYKFLTVALWFGILGNFANGVNALTGNRYEGLTDAMYAKFPALKGWDIFLGLSLWVLAGLVFAAWAGLKEYRAYGPKLLVISYIANAALNVVYTYAIVDILGDTSLMSNFVGVGVTIAFAIYNYKYFKEREELFIN